jgi:hypothetical protein
VAVVATIGVLPGMSGEVESSMTVTRCRRMNGRLSTTDRRGWDHAVRRGGSGDGVTVRSVDTLVRII